jgi:hypothetical protein
LQHEEVVYLGVMPAHLGSLTNRCQFQTREFLTLIAEVKSFFADAAIVGLTESIPVRSSLLRPATAATISELVNREVCSRSLLLNGNLVITHAFFIRGATEATIATRGHQLPLLSLYHLRPPYNTIN